MPWVNEKTGQRVCAISYKGVQLRPHSVKGSNEQKVGDYYASFMDEDSIDAKKLTPLAREMTAISAITNKAALAAYLGTTLNSEVDGLIANADHIFGLWINQGFEDPNHNVVHLWQGGLGLPDRDNYLDPSPKMAESRTLYQTHITTVLKFAGIADAESKAAQILSLETRIAQAFAPDADAADTFKQNNPWKACRIRSQSARHGLGRVFQIGRTGAAGRFYRLATFGSDRRVRSGGE